MGHEAGFDQASHFSLQAPHFWIVSLRSWVAPLGALHYFSHIWLIVNTGGYTSEQGLLACIEGPAVGDGES